MTANARLAARNDARDRSKERAAGRADHPWSAAVERGRSGVKIGARLRRVRRPEPSRIVKQVEVASRTTNERHAVAPLPEAVGRLGQHAVRPHPQHTSGPLTLNSSRTASTTLWHNLGPLCPDGSDQHHRRSSARVFQPSERRSASSAPGLRHRKKILSRRAES